MATEELELDVVEALQRARKQYEARIAAIDVALANLDGELGTLPVRRKFDVGDDKIAAVREYLAKAGEARQADIRDDLKFNSGTVSVALKALEAQGIVRQTKKSNRSMVWAIVR